MLDQQQGSGSNSQDASNQAVASTSSRISIPRELKNLKITLDEYEAVQRVRNGTNTVQLRNRSTLRKPPNPQYSSFFTALNIIEPQSYPEAMDSPQKDLWIAALESEEQSLLKNKTYSIVMKPSDAKRLTGKWVFKIKRNAK